MPPPSSVMTIFRRPPPSVKMSTRLAPASIAFSTSSFTTLAGRSTTSPAAMRLTTCSGSWRTGMNFNRVSIRGMAQFSQCGGKCTRLEPIFTLRQEVSIVEAACAAPCLDVTASFLAFQAALLRSMRRSGRPPRLGPVHGLAQQRDETFDRVGTIALLGAEALGLDHDHAILGHALAGEA